MFTKAGSWVLQLQRKLPVFSVAVINQAFVEGVLTAALRANFSVQVFSIRDLCYTISYSRK